MVNPDAAFWAGKSVLITGHTGFKGTWLTHWLHGLGARLAGFSLPPEGATNLFTDSRAADKIRHVIGDIRDPLALDRTMAETEPEIVFHLAAQPLVRLSYRTPIETFATNVMGTANVLEAVRSCAATTSIVVVTTDKTYENRETSRPYVETDALGGYDPYSASKAAAELVSAAYRSSFLRDAGKSLATARAGNVLGGGDWAEDRLVPDCIRSFQRGEIVSIRSPGSTRPWQHVLEPLAGYILLAERLHKGDAVAEAFNFGPSGENDSSVLRVVDALSRRWGNGARWEQDAAPKVHEAGLLAVDSTKARNVLGWRPRLNLADTIDWTADWYKEAAAGASAEALTVAQIAAYIEKEPLPS